MIEIRNLKKVWDSDQVEVLSDINLEIQDGEIFALVGRSGAGKSTLLRCINGLTSYQEGSLKVDGQEVGDLSYNELRQLRRKIGMIFQQFSLLERETVYRNVALPMKCWKYSNEEIDKRVRELLELVGLSDKMDARPRNLSGGQKQRVAIARALTMEPTILLCDEATSALDPKTTTSILELLQEINRKIGITIVVVTHQMEVVRKVCQRACILEHGKIVVNDTVKNIFIEQPDALLRLLGDDTRLLPTTGHNLQLAFLVNEKSDGEVFGKMYTELGFTFPIVSGTIQNYDEDNMGVFVINVEEDLLETVVRYLESNEINWREISREEIERQSLKGGEDE